MRNADDFCSVVTINTPVRMVRILDSHQKDARAPIVHEFLLVAEPLLTVSKSWGASELNTLGMPK